MRPYQIRPVGLFISLLTATLVMAPGVGLAKGGSPLATIPFDQASGKLGPDGVALLEQFAMTSSRGAFKVVGYSCYEDDPALSEKMAADRAAAVADWLAGVGRAPQEVSSVTAPCGTPEGSFGRVARLLPLGADPSPTDAAASKTINIDFKDAEIQTVVRTFAELSGKNVVIDEKVKGKVTIISPKEVSEAEAVRVFQSALEVYGYSMVEAGNVIKVVPTLEARQKATFASGDPGDTLVTRLIPLKSVKAMELSNTLRPLIPATSYLAAYAPSNTLIITDFASNVEKLMKIIDQIDSPMHEESVTVVQLRFAGAKELTDKLAKIFGGESGGATSRPGQPPQPNPATGAGAEVMGQPQIIADERINSLIIVAARPVTDQIMALIAQLDVPSPRGRGRINVHYLKFGDAEEMAKVLNNIAGQATPQPGRPGVPSQAAQLADKVTVTPDKATNSLVITASVEDYETLKEVIDRLDIRRRQVFVEALIMEVSSTKSRQFGIEWRSTADFNQSGLQPYGGQDFGNINNTAANPLAAPLGMAIGVVDGVIEYGGNQFLNIGALAHALQTDAEVNVLSTPNILTTDNEEAEIIVADEVPLEGQTTVTTGGNTVSNIERKNVGLTLKLTPQISASDELRLDVYQEISNIKNVQLDKAKDLITTKRSIKTTVVVGDGQNVVLGGLIQDDSQDTENKVPGLGDIPLLGWLFKSSDVQHKKTNLLVFLTPHIIHERRQVVDLTDRQRERIDIQDEVSREAYDRYRGRSSDPLKEKYGEGKDAPSVEPTPAPEERPVAAPDPTETTERP